MNVIAFFFFFLISFWRNFDSFKMKPWSWLVSVYSVKGADFVTFYRHSRCQNSIKLVSPCSNTAVQYGAVGDQK